MYIVLGKMQIIPFIFLIFDHIAVSCVLSGATLLSYVVLHYWICTGQDNRKLTHLLTIHGSNSYQDNKAKSLELKKKWAKLFLIQ